MLRWSARSVEQCQGRRDTSVGWDEKEWRNHTIANAEAFSVTGPLVLKHMCWSSLACSTSSSNTTNSCVHTNVVFATDLYIQSMRSTSRLLICMSNLCIQKVSDHTSIVARDQPTQTTQQCVNICIYWIKHIFRKNGFNYEELWHALVLIKCC